MIKQKIVENNIKVIFLDGEKGNMLNVDDITELLEIIDKEKNDIQTKGLIITGLNRSFCVGLKVQELSNSKFILFEIFDNLLLNLFSLTKPLIVAASGHSIGGGLLIQLCADYIIMSDNQKIKIGLPELALNTTLDALMLNVLEYSFGNSRNVQRLVYSGQYIQPEQALQYKLCDELIDDTQIFQTALGKMKQLIAYDAHSFANIKKNLRIETIKKMQDNLNKRCYNIYKTIIK
ncbi:Enoyl-CoA hydratase [termite gut metagenome]|uniref:Enoyl-CoA hydratase n=1 Tax=termite gut metagenome TaxID=433724 RepID=A0A5J4SSJ5_9ZZZZ